MAPSKKQLVKQFRTSGILQAARRVFGEKGYERATIDEIARAAGVAKGTVSRISSRSTSRNSAKRSFNTRHSRSSSTGRTWNKYGCSNWRSAGRARTGAIRSVRSRPVAFAVFDITWGLITQRLRGWSETTIDQDVSFAVDLSWKGMTER